MVKKNNGDFDLCCCYCQFVLFPLALLESVKDFQSLPWVEARVLARIQFLPFKVTVISPLEYIKREDNFMNCLQSKQAYLNLFKEDIFQSSVSIKLYINFKNLSAETRYFIIQSWVYSSLLSTIKCLLLRFCSRINREKHTYKRPLQNLTFEN